jgi:hypothetical protein
MTADAIPPRSGGADSITAEVAAGGVSAMPARERAAGEQQGGEGQGVGVHHPLHPGDADVQSRPIDRSATLVTVASRMTMK